MGEFEVAGPVTCVRVEGDQAAIKYRFSQASGSAATFKGGGVEIFIEDNGNPVNGRSVDGSSFLAPIPGPPPGGPPFHGPGVCPPPPQFLSAFFLEP